MAIVQPIVLPRGMREVLCSRCQRIVQIDPKSGQGHCADFIFQWAEEWEHPKPKAPAKKKPRKKRGRRANAPSNSD